MSVVVTTADLARGDRELAAAAETAKKRHRRTTEPRRISSLPLDGCELREGDRVVWSAWWDEIEPGRWELRTRWPSDEP